MSRREKFRVGLNPLYLPYYDELCELLPENWHPYQGLRTIAEQNALYEQGRTKPGNIVTNAKGGSSYHNYGLAIDLVQMIDGKVNWNFDYKKLKPYADKYGIVWGGTFKSIVDKPHFEISFGFKPSQLKNMRIENNYVVL